VIAATAHGDDERATSRYLPLRNDVAAEMTSDEHPERQDPSSEEGVSTEADEVRAAMEHTREALEASAAELERAKRLLRETAASSRARRRPMAILPAPPAGLPEASARPLRLFVAIPFTNWLTFDPWVPRPHRG